MMLPLNSIVSGDIYSMTAIEQYAAIMAAGVELPPILVRRVNDDRYAVVDGNHRTEAHRRLGRSEIAAIEVGQ
jgi:ParB-like chromosome segregation protein Spo0J